MVRRVRELGWSAAQAAEAAGVSVRTVRKWLARHRTEGAAGLLDRSSRPRSSLPPIAASWQTLIVRLRQCRTTAEEIASRLHLARSTVAAELVCLGLNRPSALAPKEPAREMIGRGRQTGEAGLSMPAALRGESVTCPSVLHCRSQPRWPYR